MPIEDFYETFLELRVKKAAAFSKTTEVDWVDENIQLKKKSNTF